MGHIIVTGAGSGLGRALTIGLVERGHQVSMMGRRYQKLQEQEELLGKAVIGIAADLKAAIVAMGGDAIGRYRAAAQASASRVPTMDAHFRSLHDLYRLCGEWRHAA